MKKALPVLTMLLTLSFVFSPMTLAQESTKTPKLVLEGDGQRRTPPPFDRQPSADPEAEKDDDEAEDDEPVQRVARVSFIDGDVSFLRAGVTEWSDAVENLPLLAGDQIYVGEQGRAEIQFGRGNYVRLSAKTALTISELTQTAAVLEVTEGIAIVRLERFGLAWERFEVDTPNSALVFQQDGQYRVNVRGDNESEIVIRRGAAEVACDDGNFKVREGQRLTVDTRPQGRLEIAADTSNDDWDRWSHDRDQVITQTYVATAPDYVTRYETDYHSFYGVSDLSGYGSWISYSNYGNCWVPRVDAGWAPYRAGQWIWIPRTGWTWLAREPWGWAPYHYGRWVYLNNIGWAWSPGINTRHYSYRHSYYQWRPALVAFFNYPTPRGNYVGWYPLAPGERWRRPHHQRNDNRRSDNGHRHLQYPVARDGNRRPNGGNPNANRPGFGNGVSVLPVNEFVGNRRSDRLNPLAPDRDVNDWVNRGARAGLPDLGNAENGAATVWRRGNAFAGSRRPLTPPAEILKRPVVTRQRPADKIAETSAPRERRLISSPAFRQGGDGVPRGGRFHDAATGGIRPRGKDGQTTVDDSRGNPGQENKRRRNDAANGGGSADSIDVAPRPRRPQPAGDESTGGSDGRIRPRTVPGDEGNSEANRNRERNPRRFGNPDSQDGQNRPNPDVNNGANSDSRPRPKQSGDDTTRTYTPREQPAADRSERQQRKEERRQEQQRQEQKQPERPRHQEAPPARQERQQEKQERRAQQQQQQTQRQAEKQQRKNNQ